MKENNHYQSHRFNNKMMKNNFKSIVKMKMKTNHKKLQI